MAMSVLIRIDISMRSNNQKHGSKCIDMYGCIYGYIYIGCEHNALYIYSIELSRDHTYMYIE